MTILSFISLIVNIVSPLLLTVIFYTLELWVKTKTKGESSLKIKEEVEMKKADLSTFLTIAMANFAEKLIPSLHERGVSDEQIRFFLQEKGQISISIIADIMASDILQRGEFYPVTFNYDESLTEKLADYRGHIRNELISGPNYQSGDKKSGVIKSYIRLVPKTEEVIAEMEKAGYRFAHPGELFDFGKRHPSALLNKSIIALGSRWFPYQGGEGAACIIGDEEECRADIHKLSYVWPDWNWHVAFVPKKMHEDDQLI